jgi:hypothetical protein
MDAAACFHRGKGEGLLKGWSNRWYKFISFQQTILYLFSSDLNDQLPDDFLYFKYEQLN